MNYIIKTSEGKSLSNKNLQKRSSFMGITLFPKKISTQTMGLKMAQCEEIAESNQGKAVPVLRVWGIASSKTAGVTQFGPYLKFSGEFAALNYVTGEEARSQGLLLPAVAEGVVASLVDKAAKTGGQAQIGIEITVEYNNSAKGGTKFKYGVTPLFEYKGDDALAEMAKQLPTPKLLKALPDSTAKTGKK